MADLKDLVKPSAVASNKKRINNKLDFTLVESSSNLGTARVDFNFKVSEEFRTAFKTLSVVNGIKMVDLLTEMFNLYTDPNNEELLTLAKKRNSKKTNMLNS